MIKISDADADVQSPDSCAVPLHGALGSSVCTLDLPSPSENLIADSSLPLKRLSLIFPIPRRSVDSASTTSHDSGRTRLLRLIQITACLLTYNPLSNFTLVRLMRHLIY